MMRTLILSILLLCAPGLKAAGWDQVTLFDWVYPGEASYEALKQGAVEAQTQHWAVERLRRNEKLPQASARELARVLQSHPNVNAATKEQLAKLLASEGAQLGLGDASGALGKADALNRIFDEAGARMDAVDLTYKTNNYGKGNTPSLGMEAYAGYRGDNPGGMMQNRNRSFLLGGAVFTMTATLDKATVALGLGARYWGGENTRDTRSYLDGFYKTGAFFQLPLDDGGIEVHMGDVLPVFFSPLLFGNIFQEGREAFFVDVIGAFRQPRVIKVLDMEYPAFTREITGLYVKRQGQAWYWPFSRTQFAYVPNPEWWMFYDEKVNTWSLRLDRDIHGNAWLDPGLYYIMAQGSGQDTDQMAGTPYIRRKTMVEAYGAGLELRSIQGTQLRVDAAMSNFSRELVIDGPRRSDPDSAVILTLGQPVGAFNFAFETGMAGPRFLSRPQLADRLQNGAVPDSMTYTAWANGDPDRQSWLSYLKDASIMSNNTSRMLLKGQWTGSWLSMGVFGGVINQINPTDGRVIINPVLQGRDENGYGLFRLFGPTYAQPPDPMGAAPSAIDGPGRMAQYLFNRPTDGTAVPYAGEAPVNVHWQEMSQLSYREVFFTTLLSQQGVGDNQVLTPSAKVYNVAGGRLVFDLGALLERDLPSAITVIGELRDLALQAGVPSLDGSNLFSQNHVTGVWEHGLTPIWTVLAKAGFESWKTKQSFYPVDMQMVEFGGGMDLRLDPLLTGLQANMRATTLQFDDLNRPSRAFSLWTLSLGTTLTY